MSIQELEKYKNYHCACGKIHSFSSRVVTGSDILDQICGLAEEYSASNVYVVCDKNTYAVAGKRVIDLLGASGKKVSAYIFESEKVVPDETSVGKVVMHMNQKCDLIVGVGSGVINDVCKIVANISSRPYFIVATAPSMDGYAAAGSSMEVEGVKTTVSSKAPDVIIGDFDILASAPAKMILSGLGDMIAKYVALCEWRIANILVGEYYCDEIASLVRVALQKCVSHAEGLLRCDKEAVGAVFEGLIISGAAMEYAGISRPASGAEHYFSHVLDMRSLAFDLPCESHGIQCAVGTLYVLKAYERLKGETPDRERALAFVQSYRYSEHAEFLKKFLGKAADKLIALEEKEGKYSVEKHARRLEVILQNWDALLKIMKEELPSYEEIRRFWKSLGGPVSLEEIGVDHASFAEILPATKDIRDKYVLSFLLWDLGLMDAVIEGI